MAYTALYREWRPKKFGEVVGQEHVTRTLRNQVKDSRIAHAYLLCGTRGTGKTSTAKILSKAVNCLNPKDGEPCNECEMCRKINDGTEMDVVEIDAASHRGIDKIRDIIDDVKYPPSEARYKVYIIDEVHMLTLEAVNAFLKTLEEPPKNVIFILATTDPQKLPITILSRCQRFDFKRIKSSDIYKRLREIADKEGILADDKSLNLIARMGDGALRDALSIMDEAVSMSDGKIEYDNVINMLGLVTNENLIRLTDTIIEKNVEKAMHEVDDIVLGGKDVYTFIRDMISHMRNLMMVKISRNPEEVIDMSIENIKLLKAQSEKIRIEELMRFIKILQEAENESKWSRQGRIYLELAVIKMCRIEYDTSNEVIIERINKLESALKTAVSSSDLSKLKSLETSKKAEIKKEHTEDNEVKEESKESSENDEEALDEEDQSLLTLSDIQKSFKDILEVFKSRRFMVIYACLITGKVEDFKNRTVYISFPESYAFSKKRLEEDENKKTVKDVFCEVLKEKVRIQYIIEGDKKKDKNDDLTEDLVKKTFGEDVVKVID